MPERPYSPLDVEQLGENVANKLLHTQPIPIGQLSAFVGAGVYAIYYAGPFPAYAEIARGDVPIYVGKAVPQGARVGIRPAARQDYGRIAEPSTEQPVIADPVESVGPVLYQRLRNHGESIRKAVNLEVEDFTCRYLVVEDIWIPLGESVLIQRFAPLWNTTIDGFGNNDPGKGRYQQERSRWDTIHPGRPWAVRCQERRDIAELLARWCPNLNPRVS